MSIELNDRPYEEQDYETYRVLSIAAVLTLVLGLISLTAIVLPVLLIVPVVGLLLGAYSVARIRRRSHEMSGLAAARLGIALCAIGLVAGAGRSTYIYATEVPEGCQRISFAELQPDEDRPDLPIPPTALELDGQRVFVKGYVYPDGQGANIKRFVLIPDMGTCCFGGQPKLTDMIQVTLADPLRIKYSYQRRKLAGVLKVDRRLKPISGLKGVYYQLEADYVQ